MKWCKAVLTLIPQENSNTEMFHEKLSFFSKSWNGKSLEYKNSPDKNCPRIKVRDCQLERESKKGREWYNLKLTRSEVVFWTDNFKGKIKLKCISPKSNKNKDDLKEWGIN